MSDLNKYLESIPEWTDEIKCRALFSSMPNSIFEDDDTDRWSYKVNFWYPLILHATLNGLLIGNENSIFSFSLESLRTSFKRNGIYPLGLTSIITFFMRRKLIFTYEDFLKLEMLNSEPTRIASLIMGIIQRLSKFFNAEKECLENTHKNQRFIPIDNLKIFSNELFSLLPSNGDLIDSLLTSQELFEYCKIACKNLSVPAIHSDAQDFTILIHYLIIAYPSRFQLIKPPTFKDNPSVCTLDHESILNICSLKRCVKEISSKLVYTERNIDILTEEISRSLQNKFKALNLLKRKKSLLEHDKILNQNQANLIQVLDSIRITANAREVKNALQMGSTVLKSIISSFENTPSNIDDLMLDVDEEILLGKQLSNYMIMLPSNEPYSELCVEEELNKLLEDQVLVASKEKESNLPKREVAKRDTSLQLPIEKLSLNEN